MDWAQTWLFINTFKDKGLAPISDCLTENTPNCSLWPAYMFFLNGDQRTCILFLMQQKGGILRYLIFIMRHFLLPVLKQFLKIFLGW